ncbi:MAG: hypothetical protein ACRDY6_06520 [Acidimicrobiia bacterium]
MLEVSARAAAFVDETRRALGLPESAGPRLSARGATGRHALEVKLASVPNEGDDVVEREGAKVFVAPELRELVSGRVLELEEHAEQPKLVCGRAQGVVIGTSCGSRIVMVPRLRSRPPDAPPEEAPLEDPDERPAAPEKTPEPEPVPA